METTTNPLSSLWWVQVKEDKTKWGAMWVKLSCSSPRVAQSASIHQKRLRAGQGYLGTSRTGYLGTNALWAKPTWDRQAGLPGLMYALPSPAVACHPSAHAGFCAALRFTQSLLPLEL